MNRTLASIAGSTALLLAAAPGAAQPVAAPAVAVPGWNEFVDRLRDLPARMLAKLPEAQRQDPQVQQEIARLALEAVAASSLDTLASDPAHPAFVTQSNEVLNIGQPNADTNYRMARIAAEGVYRLRGVRGSQRILRVAEFGPRPGEPGFVPPKPGVNRPVHDLNLLHTDAKGRFDVILSQTRPVGYKGDWWPLQPTTTGLLLRFVKADWNSEKEATISIERLDTPVARPRPAAAELERNLRKLPQNIDLAALIFVDHVQKLRQDGFVNKLKVFDTAALGGLAGQFYYEGVYDLKDNEALIIEAKVPAKCLYHSIILTNGTYETTDWYNNLSSLNDTQSKTDKDGVLRVVVSAKDPGVPNWLDTAGYPTGAIQGRWLECDAQPVPTVRKVALADVRKALPPETPTVTPEQRDRTIRDRRSALQQRPLW
jgi:hypothetical protein